MTASEHSSATLDSTQKRPVVCVFCGANDGSSPAYLEAARAVAQVFHENNISLVYGGGTVGIMGEIARTLVSLSGPSAVHGIIPAPLVKHEQRNKGSSGPIDEAIYGRTTIVPDMHTRKRQMAQEVINGGPGSGFLTLPGGYGTLEELMEITTWNQLGIHAMPVVLLNVEGYWDGLIQWIRKAVASKFVSENCSDIVVEALDARGVVEALNNYKKAEGRFDLTWNSE